MMKRDHVIKLVGLQGVKLRTEHDGRWLKSFNPEKYHPESAPLGGIRSTDDPGRHALAFYTYDDAVKFWSQTHPLNRPDGKPSRPLTAYLVQIERLATIT